MVGDEVQHGVAAGSGKGAQATRAMPIAVAALARMIDQ